MVRLIGFCLLAAVMTMLLRQMNPGVAALLCVAFGAMTLLMLPSCFRTIWVTAMPPA